jgi:hypothetical protein
MPHEHDLICPFCFTIYPEGVLDPDMPVCRECNFFGRAIIVENYLEFLSGITLGQIESIRTNWQQRNQLLEAEREMVLKNIDSLLDLIRPTTP